jgi:hypothetical protein
MRTVTTRTIRGAVLATGVVQRGLMSCRRTSAGNYVLTIPAGMKMLGFQVVPLNLPAWGIFQIGSLTDTQVTVIMANTGGTATVDAPFQYVAEVAA